MDMEQYQDQFPRACKCQKLVDTPEKIKKFLVGMSTQYHNLYLRFKLSTMKVNVFYNCRWGDSFW